jgi:hypothetical protein
MDHLLFSDATSVAKSINITVGSGLIKTNWVSSLNVQEICLKWMCGLEWQNKNLWA